MRSVSESFRGFHKLSCKLLGLLGDFGGIQDVSGRYRGIEISGGFRVGLGGLGCITGLQVIFRKILGGRSQRCVRAFQGDPGHFRMFQKGLQGIQRLAVDDQGVPWGCFQRFFSGVSMRCSAFQGVGCFTAVQVSSRGFQGVSGLFKRLQKCFRKFWGLQSLSSEAV